MALETYGYACNSHPAGWVFGWFTSGNERHVKMLNMDRQNPDISDPMMQTAFNILSYVPVFCIISGIYHSRRADWFEKRVEEVGFRPRDSNTKKEDLQFYAMALRYRAKAEYCHATVLLLLVDLIVSMGRLSFFRPQRA